MQLSSVTLTYTVDVPDYAEFCARWRWPYKRRCAVMVLPAPAWRGRKALLCVYADEQRPGFKRARLEALLNAAVQAALEAP